MKRATRGYGAVLFWQFAWFATVSLPVATLAAWFASGGRLLMSIWAVGLLVGTAAGALMARDSLNRFLFAVPGEESDRSRTTAPQPLGRLTLRPEFEALVWFPIAHGFLATAQAIQTAQSTGYATTGMVAYLLCWLFLFAGSWGWWALLGRHPVPQAAPPPFASGSGPIRARIIPREAADGAETLTVSVSARRSASTEEVLRALLLAQLIPAIPGGEQRWTARVDGEEAALVTQTWKHPHWWPPIEWISDPTAPFTAERRISFAPAEASENADRLTLRFQEQRTSPQRRADVHTRLTCGAPDGTAACRPRSTGVPPEKGAPLNAMPFS